MMMVVMMSDAVVMPSLVSVAVQYLSLQGALGSTSRLVLSL